jgi:hypothetical protein
VSSSSDSPAGRDVGVRLQNYPDRDGTVTDYLAPNQVRRFAGCPVNCVRLRERVSSLGDFFSVVYAVTGAGGEDPIQESDAYWFRGHSDVRWRLIPSALRYKRTAQREKALASLYEFMRIADIKLPRPPAHDDPLAWVQVAQHFGLPTRLLDWTQSATTGLYFACMPPDDKNGILFLFKPGDLNELGPTKTRRPLTIRTHREIIEDYLALGAVDSGVKGRAPLAIDPVRNSERLLLQRGTFTLHGSRFSLDRETAPSLVGLPILKEEKKKLRRQLSQIGVDRLTIFPELEHTCVYLRTRIEEL